MRYLVLCLSLAFGPSCWVHAAERADELRAIEAADTALQEAIVAEDLDRIVSFYAEDAVLLPTAEPLIDGKAAIREEWQHVLAIPDFQSESVRTKADVSGSGDLGYTMGTYLTRMRGEDGKPVDEPGKWLSIWKRQADGSWRIAVETYNTDIPPPDHK